MIDNSKSLQILKSRLQPVVTSYELTKFLMVLDFNVYTYNIRV